MTDKRYPRNEKCKPVRYKTPTGYKYTTALLPEDDYLETEIWKELREKRKIIDGLRCAICGAAYNLHVHHTNYPGIWGEEDVENDLITLCDSCHEKIHGKNKKGD